jgi:hypothetical protein
MIEQNVRLYIKILQGVITEAGLQLSMRGFGSAHPSIELYFSLDFYKKQLTEG